MLAQESPSARGRPILARSTITRDRPRRLPFARVPQSNQDTHGNQAALKLGHGAQDRKNHPARWRGRLERFPTRFAVGQ